VRADLIAAPGADRARVAVRRIQPSRRFVPLDFGELWRFRELLYFLVWRDVKARYKQTFLGPLWAILRPLILMVIFSIIFGGLAGIDPGSGVPYPLFVFAGLLAWTYVSLALIGGSSSIVNNSNLVAKAYFPRLFAPVAAVIAPLVDLVLALTVLLGLFVWYAERPGPFVFLLPVFLLLAALLALGVSLWLASATISYRDVPFALPFVTQLWMYATPVIYPVTFVPEKWQWLLELNPLTAVVEGFRWSLLGTEAPSVLALTSSFAFAFVLVVGGAYFFRSTERTLADMM
jgi:lipopolysaccharide transport system permease protein